MSKRKNKPISATALKKEKEQKLIEEFYNTLKKKEEFSNFDEDILKKLIIFMVEELKDVPVNIRLFYIEVLFINKDIFNKINPEFFIRVVRHLRLIGEQKREKYHYGANIIISSNADTLKRNSKASALPLKLSEKNNSNVPLSINIKQFFLEHKADLEKAYSYTNVNASYFLYQSEKNSEFLTPHGVFDFEDKGQDDVFNKMKNLCSGDNIGFSLIGGTSCIRIFFNSEHFADYTLNESTGSWIVRFTSQIRDMFDEINLDKNITNTLVEQIIKLAYLGRGALIIITPDMEDKAEVMQGTGTDISDKKLTLSEANAVNHFVDLASVDGAVIIEKVGKDAKINRFGVILSPIQDLSADYKKLFNKSTCGSRHKKAAKYACQFPDDYVIVVSENKTISFLHGTKPIYWRDKEEK